MNFLRTQSLQRISDILKVQVDGEEMKTQSNLNIQSGRNIAFQQTEAKDLTTLVVTAGKNGVLGYWGSFWSTETQLPSSTTEAYLVSFNSADPNNDGVDGAGGIVTPTTPGVYNIGVSVQLVNSDTQLHDATFWFLKNGANIPDSASVVTVPNRHGSVDGRLIFYVDYALRLEVGDTMAMAWCATNTALSLSYIAAGVNPTRPASPSMIMTVVQV